MAGWDDPAGRIRELETEVERLRGWKEEALPVIFGLQDLGRALDMRLGTTITGPAALEAVEKLKAERDTARETAGRQLLIELAAELDGDDRDIPEQRVRRDIASYLRTRSTGPGGAS